MLASIFCFIILSAALALTGQSMRTVQLITQSTVGPVRLGPAWADRSPVACLASCVTTYASCTSFMYNPVTRLCTPGSELTSSVLPTASEGDLYVMELSKQAACDTSQGFSVQSYGSEVSCIGYFSAEFNWGMAKYECSQKGAHLANVTTTDKLKILQAVAATLDFWIGCSDESQTSTYTWDGGEPLSSQLMTQIFAPGESTETHSTGNCCQYCPHNKTVLVYDCSDNAPFVCEM